MHHHLSPSRPTYPSDTGLLVDACIAHVRDVAGLDDDVVLPPLPKLAPRRDVVVFAKSDFAAADAAALDARKRREARTECVSRSSTSLTPPKRRARWPLALCGFVAGAFACAAVLASPVGRRPAIAHATQAARSILVR